MKNWFLLLFLSLSIGSMTSQTKVGSFGLTNKLNSDGEFVFTFNFDLNRTDASKESTKDLAFWLSDSGTTKNGNTFNFGIFPVSDINLGDGVKASNNNISAGILFDYFQESKLSRQSAHFISASLEYNADKNFVTKIFTFNPSYKLYLAKKNKLDAIVGVKYSMGSRDTDSAGSSTYLAPEFLFSFNSNPSSKLTIKNSFRAIYLQNDNEAIVKKDKTYFYNKLSIDYKIFSENNTNRYSTVGVKHEIGRIAPLFQELNTISLALSLYLDLK